MKRSNYSSHFFISDGRGIRGNGLNNGEGSGDDSRDSYDRENYRDAVIFDDFLGGFGCFGDGKCYCQGSGGGQGDGRGRGYGNNDKIKNNHYIK